MVNCAVEGQRQEKLWWSSDTEVQNVCYIGFFGLKTNRTIWWLTPSAFFPQDNRNWTALSGKANDWRNQEHVVLDRFSKLENVWDPRDTLGEPPNHVMTLCGQILVSGVCVVWHNENSVCPLKTSPCVLSKRPRVYRHHAHMCFKHVHAARGAGIHGDVLNVHTEAFLNPHTVFFHIFSACRNTHKHTQTHTPNTHHDHHHHHQPFQLHNQQQRNTPHTQYHNDTPHNTRHNITRRQRQTETERQRETERVRARRQRQGEKRRRKRRDKREERRWKRSWRYSC